MTPSDGYASCSGQGRPFCFCESVVPRVLEPLERVSGERSFLGSGEGEAQGII